jgi:hypothetical protein
LFTDSKTVLHRQTDRLSNGLGECYRHFEVVNMPKSSTTQSLLGTAVSKAKITIFTWCYTTMNTDFFENLWSRSSNPVSHSLIKRNWDSWTFQMLTFFLLMTIFPYTRMSLKRKNCRALGFFLHILVRTPSPTSTRPGTPRGYELNRGQSEICNYSSLMGYC